MPNRNYIFITIIVLIIAVLGYAGYRDLKPVTNINNAPIDSNSTSTLPVDVNIGTSTDITGGDYTVEQVDEIPSIPHPDLNRYVIGDKTLDAATKKAIEDSLRNMQEALKKNPNNAEDWFKLAMSRKVAADYEGARLVWEYTAKRYPSDYLSYLNLANVHAYYIPNVKLAEQYYLKAIESSPQQVFAYFQTAEFYQNIVKNKAKALAIAEKGLQENPNNPDLKKLVDSLK